MTTTKAKFCYDFRFKTTTGSPMEVTVRANKVSDAMRVLLKRFPHINHNKPLTIEGR